MVVNISVVFPAYNEEYTIEKMVLDALAVLKTLADDYEVIIVDDCSSDRTREIADNLVKKFHKVRVIHHKENRGYGMALRSGFASASKDWIFYTDSDSQFNIKDLGLLVKKADSADIITGYRFERSDPLFRAMLSRVYNWIARNIFNLRVRDVNCGFKLIRRSVFDKVKLNHNSGIIWIELMKKASMHNFRIREVKLHYFNRKFGRSRFFKVKTLLRSCRDLVILWVELVVLRKE